MAAAAPRFLPDASSIDLQLDAPVRRWIASCRATGPKALWCLFCGPLTHLNLVLMPIVPLRVAVLAPPDISYAASYITVTEARPFRHPSKEFQIVEALPAKRQSKLGQGPLLHRGATGG